MKNLILFVLFFSLFSTIAISQTKEEKKQLKKEADQKQFESIKVLIDSKTYVFEGEWLTTQKGQRINLIGNPNYMKINNKNAEADLPYYGEVQIPSYGSSGGIEFNGPTENYQVKYNDKKQKVIITFKAKKNTESYSINLSVTKNSNASLIVTSSGRNVITYNGKIKPLEIKE